MPRGGARNRSGRTIDPASAYAEKKGVKLEALPASGYDGPIPDFPLPEPSARELELWAKAWTWPQAYAWALEPWRVETVGMWVRQRVRCEHPKASAVLLAGLHRYADQIGLTTAGLREMGWTIAAEKSAAVKPTPPKPTKRRLRAA